MKSFCKMFLDSFLCSKMLGLKNVNLQVSFPLLQNKLLHWLTITHIYQLTCSVDRKAG